MTGWDDNCSAMKNFGNCLEALDFNRFPGPSSLAGCGDRDAYPHIPNECLGEGGKGVASRRCYVHLCVVIIISISLADDSSASSWARVKVSQEASLSSSTPPRHSRRWACYSTFGDWKTTQDLQTCSVCNKASMEPSIISIVDNVNLDRIVFWQKGTS